MAATALFRNVFQHHSLWVGGMFAGAFIVERVGSCSVDTFWDSMNAGKQWNDILPAVEARWQAKLAEAAAEAAEEAAEEEADDEDE